MSAGETGLLGILRGRKIGPREALEAAVLLTIIVVACLLRVLPLQYGDYFTAFDPLFQYRATKYVVENGYAAWWTWHDTLSWYPMGRNVPTTAYPGIPFTAAALYHLQKALGLNISLYNVCLYFPVFMAALTTLAIYFLARDIFGRPAGVLAALFMAVIPAYIQRTSLGFFDTENIGVFAIALNSLFLLRAMEEDRGLKSRTLYGVLSGLSLGYLYASWGAAKYMTGLIGLYMLALVVSERFQLRHLLVYTLTMGVAFTIIYFTPRLGPMSLMEVDSLAALALAPLLLLYESVKERVDVSVLSLGFLGLLALALIAVYVLPILGIHLPIGLKFLKVLNPFTSISSHIYASVAENQVVSWANLFSQFGVVLVLALFNTYLVVRQPGEKTLYALLAFLTSLYFAGVMTRLTQILAAPACLMAGGGLYQALAPFAKPAPQARRGSRARRPLGANRYLVVALAGVLFLSMYPTFSRALEVADDPTQLASSGISLRVDGEYAKDWPQALEWMRVNLPQDAVVCSWWDYGYWIETMANRTTLADGSTQTTYQIAQIGRAMMLPPNESLKILRKYGVDYMVVFVTYNPENINIQWPFGDNVKWQWMVKIGGLDLEDYVNYTVGQYKDAYLESTLVKLMYQVPPFDVFEPVYVSEHGFVLVYKVNYPE